MSASVKLGPPALYATLPLSRRQRNSNGRRAMSQSCRYCCKKILRIRASNIDSRSSLDAQCRFKNWFAAIRLLRPRCPPATFATISAMRRHRPETRRRTPARRFQQGSLRQAGFSQSLCVPCELFWTVRSENICKIGDGPRGIDLAHASHGLLRVVQPPGGGIARSGDA